MQFKRATIDVRFSREAGHLADGRFWQGMTYAPRRIYQLPGSLMDLAMDNQIFARLEINTIDSFDPIDAFVQINGQRAYAFEIDGIVSTKYRVERFYHDGQWYILEYRFLSRENS